jgi:DNA modification methylase
MIDKDKDKNSVNKYITWLPTSRTCKCPKNAVNCLSEREWLRNQVPIWSFTGKELNIKFDAISRKYHPAIFPSVLAKRIIKNYSHENETVLDVFSGVGTTLYAAQGLKRNCIGIELNDKFAEFTARRLGLKMDDHCTDERLTHKRTTAGGHLQQICSDNGTMLDYLPPRSIDLAFTSPPYWDLLKQQPSKRNINNKKYLKTNYSDDPLDISNSKTIDDFINRISDVFQKIQIVLKPGGHCIINTIDYRRKNKYISLSSIYIRILHDLNFELRNVIIWDRRAEYEIGIFSYPRNFIVNNGMFEYILEFQAQL